MPGISFHLTGWGRIFFDHQLPELVKAAKKIGDNLEKIAARAPDSPDLNATPERNLILGLLNDLADAEHGSCFCRVHAGDCPGGDCDVCLACPTGRARSILVALGVA